MPIPVRLHRSELCVPPVAYIAVARNRPSASRATVRVGNDARGQRRPTTSRAIDTARYPPASAAMASTEIPRIRMRKHFGSPSYRAARRLSSMAPPS